MLRKYETKNIVIKIAHINAILNSNKGKSDEKICRHILGILPNNYSKILNEGILFSLPHLSSLLKYALNNYSEVQDPKIQYPEFAKDLFKTILIFNDTYNENLNSSKLANFESVFKISAVQQSYIRSTRFLIYLIKSAFMIKFLSENDYLKTYTIKFCEEYGMANPWKINQFISSIYQEISSESPKFVLQKTSIPVNFLQDWILNKNLLFQKQKKVSFNFHMIPKPLFETNDNEVIILDFNYFQYTVDQGLFYRIYDKCIKGSTSKLSKYNNFVAYIGKEYFEEYISQKILKAIFNDRNQIVFSDNIYQDFFVKSSSNNLLIIEAKMTDVHPNALENIDFEAYKNEVDENFIAKKEIKGKNKGAYQLFDKIKYVSDTNNKMDLIRKLKIKDIKKINIYPIILTSDTNYNIMGTNYYLNDIVNHDLIKLNEHFQSIQPILILNINTLIEYFGYFQQNKFALTQLIKGYFKDVNKWKKLFENNNDDYSYLKLSQSFDFYAQTKLRGKSINHDLKPFTKSFASLLSSINFDTTK